MELSPNGIFAERKFRRQKFRRTEFSHKIFVKTNIPIKLVCLIRAKGLMPQRAKRAKVLIPNSQAEEPLGLYLVVESLRLGKVRLG